MTCSYELSQLRKGWHEASTHEEDAAIEAIQELTGWDIERAEEAFMQAQWLLAEAEQRVTEEAAQAHYDKYGSWPTRPFWPRCKVEIDGYSVSRGHVKTAHSSESARMKYIWKKA